MSDYIKRSDAISLLQSYIFEHGFYCDTDADKHYTAELVDSLLSSVPAADVVERKRGEWIQRANPSYSPFDDSGEYLYLCSKCKHIQNRITNYCPNCGAEMRNLTYTLSTESGTFSFRNTTQSNNSNALENNSNALEKDGAK